MLVIDNVIDTLPRTATLVSDVVALTAIDDAADVESLQARARHAAATITSLFIVPPGLCQDNPVAPRRGHLKITTHGSAVRFAVRVQPRASATEIAGLHGDAVKIRLSAPPVEGAANDALVAFISERFAVARRRVRIVSGAQSRAKVVEVDGVSAGDVRRLLNLNGDA